MDRPFSDRGRCPSTSGAAVCAGQLHRSLWNKREPRTEAWVAQPRRCRVRRPTEEAERSVAMREVQRAAGRMEQQGGHPTGEEGALRSAAATSRLSTLRTKWAPGWQAGDHW